MSRCPGCGHSSCAWQRLECDGPIPRRGQSVECINCAISEMVKPYAEDPRPYAERLAEAQAAYADERNA